MKMGIFFIFLTFSVIFIAFMTNNINEYMGNSLDLKEINSDMNNYTINMTTAINNMIPINNKYILACEYKPKIYIQNLHLTDKIDNEKLYLINTENNEYEEILLKDYPENIPFHPQSMSLYIKNNNSILYILNHAVSYNYEGKERIEKFIIRFESKKVKLVFEEGIILPQEYFLRIQSISIINENLFYFSTNSPYETSRNSDEPFKSKLYHKKNELLKIINPMLKMKKCFIYLYNKENKDISVIDGSQSYIYGGITYDNKRNLLYAIKSIEKEMNIFEINEKGAKLIKTIQLLYVGNNIFYDNNKDKLYIGINGKKGEEESIIKKIKANEEYENIEIFSGYEIINPGNNFSINDIMVMKNNNYKWINTAIEIKGKIYMSSIYSKGIFVCDKNNL